MSTMPPCPTDLYGAAAELLGAAIEALDTIPLCDSSLDGAPVRAFVSPGVPAIDCCPQLTTHVVQVRDAPFAGGGLSEGRKLAASVTHVYLTVTIQRCVHMPDQDGNPPLEADMEGDARQMDADAWALWNHIWFLWRSGALFTICDEMFMDGLRLLGPSGGCGGWTLDIHISLSGYEEAASS